VHEVMKDVLTEALDIDGLTAVLRAIENGSILCLAVDTPVPSQFSHEILNANPYAYLDDAPLEERRARAVEMRRVLPESVLEEVGGLDPTAIAQVQAEAWPDVRDPDELHDVLHTLVALPEGSSQFSIVSSQKTSSAAGWELFFGRLVAENRAVVAEAGDRKFWVAAERMPWFRALHPGLSQSINPLKTELAPSHTASPETASAGDASTHLPTRDDAILAAVQGWMSHLGPTTAAEIGELLGVSASDVEKALLRIEATGAILRGNFRSRASREPETEWCERRLLARIHRLTVATLRKQIQPVTAAQFMNWLLRWQHIASGTQVRGEHGTLEVLRQLQGFEIPANAWERFILARRISDYDPAHIDQLCLSGVVGWGRLSPHPATLEAANGDDAGTEQAGIPAPHKMRRVIPTRVAPIAFFVREDADWMHPHHPAAEGSSAEFLSPVARALLELLRQRGALFFPDMVRFTGKLKAEVETGLWELVAAGLVTADGFENLRALVTPKNLSGSAFASLGGSRIMPRMAKVRRPRHASGRWSLLYSSGATDRDRHAESCCWMLLRRYGVVFRDLLARETNLPRWRELQIAFRRLEDRGEVRGGRFVDGFQGEQFALPVAVESLRAHRKSPLTGERIVLSAADPLNLVGIIVPGDRIPAISGRSVTFRDGVCEPDGETLKAAGD